MTEILITSIARVYADAIAKYKNEFICGFTDAWHSEPRIVLRTDDILHASNMAYNMGYVVGAQHLRTEQNTGEE